MTSALLKIVAQKQPIQDMDREVFAWLQLRAASALAKLGSVGTDNAIHNALLKLAADFRSLDDRCATAALLGKIKYEGAKVDGAATAEGLFALARDVAKAEAERVKKFHDEQIGVGGAPAARPEMFVPVDGTMTPPERFPRREVLTRLIDLRAGLQAVKPVVPADAQAKIDSLVAAINPVIVAASDKSTVELKLTGAISTMVDAIGLAIPVAAAPAAADEVASF
jgi:hypothetical protein